MYKSSDRFFLVRAMPKVTEAHLEARRQQILDAALSCFAQRGFHQTTMQDICAQAELSSGALYRYFPSKDDIIAAMGAEHRARDAAIFGEVRQRADTLGIFTELAQAYFGMLAAPESRERIRVCVELWAEALRSPAHQDSWLHNRAEVMARLEDLVRRAQRRGEINPALDATAVAQVLIGFFQAAMLQSALDPEIDVWKYVGVVLAMIGGDFWWGGPATVPELRSPGAEA